MASRGARCAKTQQKLIVFRSVDVNRAYDIHRYRLLRNSQIDCTYVGLQISQHCNKNRSQLSHVGKLQSSTLVEAGRKHTARTCALFDVGNQAFSSAFARAAPGQTNKVPTYLFSVTTVLFAISTLNFESCAVYHEYLSYKRYRSIVCRYSQQVAQLGILIYL